MLFKWPVENCFVTNPFNAKASYPFAPKKLQLHEGVDFAPALKDRDKEFLIYPAQSGAIFAKGFDARGYGNYVVVQHSERYFTWYAHMEYPCALPVAEGVTFTSVLGMMGSTGNSTGKHLHFTLQDFVNGLDNYVVKKVVDPMPLLVHDIDTVQISDLCYNILNRLIH